MESFVSLTQVFNGIVVEGGQYICNCQSSSTTIFEVLAMTVKSSY